MVWNRVDEGFFGLIGSLIIDSEGKTAFTVPLVELRPLA